MAAETIFLRGEGGGVHELDLPLPEGIAERYSKGLLTRVNADGSPYEGDTKAEVERPAKSGSRADWVRWAVSQGADAEEADGMTKADLVEHYGAG